MLTPEDMKRIEEEEWKRIAEEQYRGEFRAKLQQSVPLPQPQAAAPPKPKRTRTLVAALVVALVALTVILITVLSSRRNPLSGEADPTEMAARPASAPPPSIRYIPVTQPITSGQLVVPNGGYTQSRIEIQPEMRNAHISGTFTASGGFGNDVQPVLATESEFLNWINGHPAHVFYAPGRVTTGSFDVQLGPGAYVFGLSNRMSMLSKKNIFLDVKLSYQRMETY
jgi:hypothetical protein